MSEERWAKCPSLDGYEVSTLGRVRGKRGALKTPFWNGRRQARIKNKNHCLVELILEAFGPDEATAFALDQTRTLTEYEETEIRDAEGYKSVRDLSEEFRVSPECIRNVLA